jgi:hypothetical protein
LRIICQKIGKSLLGILYICTCYEYMTPDFVTGLCFYSQTGCSHASNIAILSHNIAILIANKLQVANPQKICKQSLWLDYKKEGSQSNSLSNWIGASTFLIVQSKALFTNLLWISTCYLLPWFQRFIFIIFIAKGRGKINLWLKAAIDSSSRANQFELGSDPDSVPWLDDCIKALWLIQIKHL